MFNSNKQYIEREEEESVYSRILRRKTNGYGGGGGGGENFNQQILRGTHDSLSRGAGTGLLRPCAISAHGSAAAHEGADRHTADQIIVQRRDAGDASGGGESAKRPAKNRKKSKKKCEEEEERVNQRS